MIVSLFLLTGLSSAGPIVAPAINTSRVKPGTKVTSDSVASELAGVRTISVSGVTGSQSERFVRAAVASLNDEHQGRYRTVADASAGAVGGAGQLVSASAGLLGNVPSIPGLDNVPGMDKIKDKAAGMLAGGTEAAASRLDGVDRHPAEGFGIVQTEPTTGDRVREGAEKVLAHEGGIQKAAQVAGAVGAGQVEDALTLGKTAAGVTAAFFRVGVEGNSPRFAGVKLPISAKEGGKADATLSASISTKHLGDKNYKKKVKRKKRNAKGKVVKDKNGKVVWETVELQCIQRNVNVKVDSKLSRKGSVVMAEKVDRDVSDEACGPKRNEQIASVEAIAAPVISSAGKSWGTYVQPQMDTIRLKFNPSATTALAIDHVMHNRHQAAMCLLQEAGTSDAQDPYPQYAQAVLLEAWGVYDEALPLYEKAQAHEDFTKARWNKGAGRIQSRQAELKRMKLAYNMEAAPTAFPHAEACPAVDRSNRQAVTKRVRLHAGMGEGESRQLHAGELLRPLGEEGKWLQVEQLDGSVGWVKAKRVFKE